ncbi:TetR family transcriptional regulator [Nitrincola alkalilacustris]|uniref:TetR family transcriptional regulator n=1 Tax=Nitrincola alkalilacustris TaxID=1571224 RepID=UPI00124BEDF5|nr:TetR family transcriptional regulator [Nitrincola alkalilacustris]
MVRKTKAEAEQTRELLLEVAMRTFSEKGLANTSLKEVAAEAGVTHGALYWHFKNRDELLRQLYFQVESPFEAQYIEQQQAARQNALNALTLYLKGILAVMASEPLQQQGYRLFRLQAANRPELALLQEQLTADAEEWRGYIRSFLKMAQKRKELKKKADIDQLADNLYLAIFGLLDLALSAPDRFSLVKNGSALVDMLMLGLRAQVAK